MGVEETTPLGRHRREEANHQRPRRTVYQGVLGASARVASHAILRAQSGPIKVGSSPSKPARSPPAEFRWSRASRSISRSATTSWPGDRCTASPAIRRRPGAGAHQDAGAGRAGQGRLPDRPARRLRGAGDRRLHPPDSRSRRSVAAAEDMTQRKANPWFVRATRPPRSSYPLGDYAAKKLEVQARRDDRRRFAYGHETAAGFQRGVRGRRRQGGAEALVAAESPDYGTYIAQLKNDVDASHRLRRRERLPLPQAVQGIRHEECRCSAA